MDQQKTRAPPAGPLTTRLLLTTHAPLLEMSERRSERKRTQPDFLEQQRLQDVRPRRARFRPGELTKPPLTPRMTTWLGLSSSARRGAAGAESGLARTARPLCPAPPPTDRQRALQLVQQYRDANPVLDPLASSWAARQRAPRAGCPLVPRATVRSWAWGRALQGGRPSCRRCRS
jgi:hypothetical protein